MIWLTLLLLLICSGTVSASETALFGLSRQALHEFHISKSPLLRRVYILMQQPRRVLLTVLITNTAVNVAIFAVSFVALEHYGSTEPAIAAAGGVAALLAVIIFGEVVPKAVALSSTRRFAPPAAALIALLQVVLAPVQWLLGNLLVNPTVRLLTPTRAKHGPVTTEELRLLVEHAAHEGVINSRENDMLQAVVALGEGSVREVMTPRVDVQSIRINDNRATIRQAVEASRRRRLPVRGRDLDDIKGVLAARDLYLNPDAPTKKLIRPVHFVPEQINLVQLIRCFHKEGTHIAVVVDEYGGTAGLVTMEDVVERIVGDLPDENAARPAATTERIDEDTYRLPGDLSVRIWADRFAVGEIERHIDTVGGLILAKLGRLPHVGDSVRISNLTLTVEQMRKRRIEKVLLRRANSGTSQTEQDR